MGSQYLIDSNILVDFLEGNMPEALRKQVSGILDEEFVISIVTKIEVLGFKSTDPDAELARVRLVDFARIVTLEMDIAEIAISFARQGASNWVMRFWQLLPFRGAEPS